MERMSKQSPDIKFFKYGKKWLPSGVIQGIEEANFQNQTSSRIQLLSKSYIILNYLLRLMY